MNGVVSWKRVVGLAVLSFLGATMAYERTVGPADDLLQVRDEIRAARHAGKIRAGEPVTVKFAPGDYVLTKPLYLIAADSGTAAAPVTWCAAQPGTVRFLGGKVIPRAAFRPVADAAVARLDPSVRSQVLVADAAPYLVKAPPAWPDHPTGVMPGPWLYHAGLSQTLARWPNRDAPDKGWTGYSNVLENCGYEADKRANKPAVIEFPGDRAARWNYAAGVWITGYLVVDWHCDTARIASYDPKTHGAKLACVTAYGVGKGGWPFYRRRFFVQNLLEELDEPGEWYLDRAAKKLYWYPQPATGADEIVLAQDLTPAIKVDGARHVTFRDIAFAYTHGGTVVAVANARHCTVKDCSFTNHGGTAVTLYGGEENRVTGCAMRNMGGTVVALGGGSEKNLLPANNMVDHCVIDNFAMYKRTHAVGISIVGCGNAARSNVITHAPDSAMNFSGNEHLIADNEFGYIAQDSGDVGCIYSGHHANWLGTILFGNYIHDLARTPAESEARNGIYFDDCDWGDDVIGNTFYHAGRAIFFGGGKLHGAYNNLVKECLVGVHVDSRGRGWRAHGNGSFYWDAKGRAFCRYRHLENGISYDEAPWCVAYPALREAMDNRPEYPGMNAVEGNVFYRCKNVYGYDGGAQLVLGKESPGNTIVTNGADLAAYAPQPIRLTEAVETRVASADGTTVADFRLDASGHFVWSLADGGREIVSRSPLGITVGYFDYGRKVVPAAAEVLPSVPLAAFTNATMLVPIRGGIGYRNVTTNTAAVAAQMAVARRIPVRSLITAKTVAYLDVRVWPHGAAYRWTVPGEGRRVVYGENDAFLPPAEKKIDFAIVEWARDRDFKNGYPESCLYPRGAGLGVCFPEFAHGWPHEGEVVSPWRGVLAR